MKEKIENKISEIIDHIVSKDANDISYNEYRILDNKLSSIKWEEEKSKNSKEMAEMLAKTLGNGFTSIAPAPLPDSKED